MHFGCDPVLVIGEDDGISIEKSFEKGFELPNGGFPKANAERARLQRRSARSSRPPLENKLGAVAAEIPSETEKNFIADEALPHLDERFKDALHTMAEEINPTLSR